jgi:type IV pilus assembly protein PilQ
MKRAIQWSWLVLFVVQAAAGTPLMGAPPATVAASAAAVQAGYLENVTFEKLQGKERVTFSVSKQSGVTVENQSGNAVVLRLENLFVPEGLRHPLADTTFSNVLRVTPVQQSAGGRAWVMATIELKQKVPYNVRQEGPNVMVDFNVASLAAAAPPEKPASQTTPAAELPTMTKAKAAEIPNRKAGKAYNGPRIFLDVQDADIKAVFRLLSEQGKVSIISGDEVKGTVTLHLKDVTWDQALDAILKVRGLAKMEQDNVVMVMSQENYLVRKKVDDELARGKEILQEKELETEPLITRVVPIKYRLLKFVAASKIEMKRDVIAAGSAVAVRTPQRAAAVVGGTGAVSTTEAGTRKVSMEGAGDFFALLQSLLSVDAEGKQKGWIGADADTNSVIITAIRADMIKIMDMIAKIDIPTEQILIKAHIVETTKSMARDLGIKWGGSYKPSIGNHESSITPSFDFSAQPSTGTAALLDLSFGTVGGNILELQLSALQKDGKLNILSSPSIMTADNQMAFTENGEEIPVRTLDKDGNPTTTYIPATLRLEITPHVIDGETMKMDIHVKKDEADMTRQVANNPFKIKKETKTNLLVRDGETIVISGLTKQKINEGTTGLPWLKDVPGLGWLFKGESKSDTMEEVLIFITPTVIKAKTVTGIQTGP